MRELDETLGDMYAVICGQCIHFTSRLRLSDGQTGTDKEIEIIYKLGQEVLEYEEMLTEASDTILFASRVVGRCRRLFLFELQLISVSHPLQELTVPSYVANDTFLVGGKGAGDQHVGTSNAGGRMSLYQAAPSETQDQPSMLMMTGPNYSGKSVHIKQIALIVYMAHVGCFVPADSAVIGLTDKILTRVATKETITKMQSAFMIDIQQVAKAINLATHRSLVIIDEFGKGTDSNVSSHSRGHRTQTNPEPPTEKVLVITADGRTLTGTLLSCDQLTNLVLGQTIERVIRPQDDPEPSAEVNHGLYLIRGENVAICGLVDEELDGQIEWTQVRGSVVAGVKHV
ncbi:MAG: hypothetical protein Q9186_002745 [Xanthomendoza sp. 1 TL-2023]